MTQTVALLLTCLCVAMIAAGQLLFKLVALRSAAVPDAGLAAHWLNWLSRPSFLLESTGPLFNAGTMTVPRP